jgi:transmembrane sensor
MDHARLDFLFHRYIDGRCSAEEERELMQFIHDNDSEKIRHLLDDLWQNTPDKLTPERADAIIEHILGPGAKPRHERRRTWLKAAAVAAFAVLSGTALYQFAVLEEAPVNYTASTSQQQFIRLPDGSTVLLNTGSTLNYAIAFDDKNTREVHLEGEAFFNISHDARRPFVVHTGTISTTVLGTAFNVKAYPGQADITVTVARGKVKVSNNTEVLGIITRDQQLTFHKQTLAAAQQVVKSSDVTAWVTKDIYFEDVTMADAMLQLQERFGVTIRFDNAQTQACRFTATFVEGEDLYQILDVICEFNKAKYRAPATGIIEIYGDGCAAKKVLN